MSRIPEAAILKRSMFTFRVYFWLLGNMQLMACLKCVVSHYSQLKVVTVMLAMIFWVQKTQFVTKLIAFSCNWHIGQLSVCLWNSKYSFFLSWHNWEYCANRIFWSHVVWAKRTTTCVLTGTVLPFCCVRSVLATWYSMVYYINSPTFANKLGFSIN